MILGTFLRSGSKGVPGRCQGPSQASPRVKKAAKWVSKWLQNHQKSYLQAFWKRFSKTRALSMFPNSSGLFLVCSYSFRFLQREILCHIYPRKVPTLIHLARGKNLRWMPPSFPLLPDVSKIAPPQERKGKKSFDFFVTWKSDPQKWSQRSQNGVPNWLKIDQKSIKRWL